MAVATDDSLEITSIFLHSSVKRLNPRPHIAYNISVQTTGRSYFVTHRYSEFIVLANQLERRFGKLKEPLPPKQPFWAFSIWTLSQNLLTDEQMRSRKDGLERWLKSIVIKEPKIAQSMEFRKFLTGTDGRSVVINSSTWMVDYESCVSLGQRAIAEFVRRDERGDTNSAEARKIVVLLVKRASMLAESLDSLARDGLLMQGELDRRTKLLNSLQDTIESLGHRLGRSHTSRVIGNTGASAKKNAGLDLLDATGHVDYQRDEIRSQDRRLVGITEALRRQRAIGLAISDEIAAQNELVNRVETGTNRLEDSMAKADVMLDRVK